MRLLSLAPLLALAACAPQVQSDQPLFAAGVEGLKPGLWAVTGQEPCAVPTTVLTLSWPDCAIPVLVAPGEVRLAMLATRRVPAALADGTPRILQLGMTEGDAATADAGPPRAWSYYAFRPSGAAPFVGGTLVALRCPLNEPLPAGVRRDGNTDEQRCVATAAGGVRALAKLAGHDGELTARWIADYR